MNQVGSPRAGQLLWVGPTGAPDALERALGHLELRGRRVNRVDTLDAARRFLDEHTPECILLDLAMPDADGLEPLVTLRAVAPTIAILVVSRADAAHDVAVHALRCGAQDHIVLSEIGADALSRSITYAIERKKAEAVVAHQAYHDPLTGLPNRTLLLDRLDAALARARRHGLLVGVLFLDLDDFKCVNDSHGHRAGDTILAVTARRLTQTTREADLVARHGGDEFVVLCEDLRDASAAVSIAHRLVRVLAVPIRAGDAIQCVGVSVGIALTDGSTDSDVLVHEADSAMYRAKREGGNAWSMTELDRRVDRLPGA